MNYGLPYKGSKNKLATRIVDLLPRRKHFYDLFCGGCAVTHAAMLSNKWEHFTINDLNWQCPTLFVDALNGKYKNDTRWISREDFFRLKDSDPYVAFVWSFGNNLKTYLYNKDIEPLKRAIHYALYFDDYEPSKEIGHDLSFIAPLKTREKKYLAIKRYFQQFGHFQQQSHEGGVRIASLSANWGGYRECNTPKQSADLEQSQTSRDAILRSSEPTLRNRSKKKKNRFDFEHHERRQRLLQTATSGADKTLAATMWGG